MFEKISQIKHEPSRAIETNWISLSGVSCSGKSTTGYELVRQGFPLSPETMRLWMERLKVEGISIPELKSKDLLSFRRNLFEVAHGIGESLVGEYGKEIRFFNRTGLDALAFMKADGLPYQKELERMASTFRFARICIFEPLPFVADGTRVNDPVYRGKTHQALFEICKELDYPDEKILHVPAYAPDGRQLSVNERSECILARLPKGLI